MSGAPKGLIAVKHGTRFIVANAHCFAAPGAAGTLGMADMAALAGCPTQRVFIPAGVFPHQVAFTPGGQVLLVTSSSSA